MSRLRVVGLGKNLFQTYRRPALILGCTCSAFCFGRNLMSTSNKKGPNEGHNMEFSRVTRKGLLAKQDSTRDHYINMSKEEKRKLYKCGDKYVCGSDIEQWATYGETVADTYDYQPKYEVDEELNQIVCLWRGDLTKLEIDGIVNAANSSLLGGGGVDGAIHAAAGFKLKEECSTLNGCSTGEAKITAGYNLPARYIIHTVGPVGVKPDKLRNAYRNSLNLAVENGVKTIAFPCISTGIYGYDIEMATPVVLETVREWLCDVNNRNKVEKIIFCVFLKKDFEVYEYNLLEYFPVKNQTPPSDGKGSSKKVKSKNAGKQNKDKKEKESASTKITRKSTDIVNGTEKTKDKENENDINASVNGNKENDIKEKSTKGNEENIRAVAELVNINKETEKTCTPEKDETADQLSQTKTEIQSKQIDKNQTDEKEADEKEEDAKDCQIDKKAKKVKYGVEDGLAPAAKKKPLLMSPITFNEKPPNAVL